MPPTMSMLSAKGWDDGSPVGWEWATPRPEFVCDVGALFTDPERCESKWTCEGCSAEFFPREPLLKCPDCGHKWFNVWGFPPIDPI